MMVIVGLVGTAPPTLSRFRLVFMRVENLPLRIHRRLFALVVVGSKVIVRVTLLFNRYRYTNQSYIWRNSYAHG